MNKLPFLGATLGFFLSAALVVTPLLGYPFLLLIVFLLASGKAHQPCYKLSQGRVTLRGVVESYYQKQMAQEAVRHVEGVDQITNELEVCWS